MTCYFPPPPPKAPWYRRPTEWAGGFTPAGLIIAAIAIGGPVVLGGLLIAQEIYAAICLCE